jgi:hypothetical protein
VRLLVPLSCDGEDFGDSKPMGEDVVVAFEGVFRWR